VINWHRNSRGSGLGGGQQRRFLAAAKASMALVPGHDERPFKVASG
jgi:hypothetical protein